MDLGRSVSDPVSAIQLPDIEPVGSELGAFLERGSREDALPLPLNPLPLILAMTKMPDHQAGKLWSSIATVVDNGTGLQRGSMKIWKGNVT